VIVKEQRNNYLEYNQYVVLFILFQCVQNLGPEHKWCQLKGLFPASNKDNDNRTRITNRNIYTSINEERNKKKGIKRKE